MGSNDSELSMDNSVKCPSCGAFNAQSNSYCGNCGKSLRPDIQTILEALTTETALAAIDQRVRAEIAKLTSRELVVRDATNEAVAKVLDFGKKAAFLIIIPATLFLGVLGYWRIHNFPDLENKVDNAKTKAIAASKDAETAEQSATAAKKDIAAVNEIAAQSKKEIQHFEDEIQKDEQRMKSAERDVQAVENEASQLGSRNEKVKRALDNLSNAAEQEGKKLSNEDVQKVSAAFDRPYPLRTTTILWLNTNGREADRYERQALSSLPVQFVTAESTAEAEQLLATHPEIRIVISNFGRGPNNPGWTFLNYVKTLPRKIPYIFYAGDVTPEHKREALEHKAFGETNDPAELFTLISQAIQQNSGQS